MTGTMASAGFRDLGVAATATGTAVVGTGTVCAVGTGAACVVGTAGVAVALP
ncbi:MAG TPA: hypothetical protein VGP91_17405 [Actinoplanes sp.]|nr:hypothetical protein [Actinoplanes sp.]